MFRKIFIFLSLVIMLSVNISISFSDENHRIKSPQISPDGTTIAFASWGDIWRVPIDGGIARRLTDHVASDYLPVWSPDGKTIAFTSLRNGNLDIFVMPAEGGVPEQLTYHSTKDVAISWTPDGKEIVFNSRNREDRHSNIYKIGLNSAIPSRITRFGGENGKVSPDGKTLLYMGNGIGGTNRKGYRGANNSDVWIMDENRNHTKLTDFDGNDEKPLWHPNGKEFFFISDRDGIFNVWKKNIETDSLTQITEFTEDGVSWISLDNAGKTLVFDYYFSIWKMDLEDGEPHQIPIAINSDYKTDHISYQTFQKDAVTASLSPDGKRIAFSVHGEIFTVRIEDNKTVQITETPYREYLPRWSSNGKYLAYLSDESGKYEIWSIPSLGGAPEQLTETQKEIVEYDWSPNGEKFYLITHDYSLYLMDSDGGNQTLLHESDGYGLYTPSWSADNKWLAYEKHDDNDQGNIFVASVEELNPTNIIVDTLYHYQVPIWSNDGKMIFFESNRDDDNWRLWAVRLTEEDYPYKKDLDRAEEEAWENIGKETETDEENEENEIEEEVSVEIKFEGIEERVHKLLDKPRTSTWTFAPSLSPDGKSIAFLVNPPDETENELWHLVLGEDEAEKIGTFSDLNQYNYSPDREKANYYNRTFMWHPEGKKVFYRTSSGELKSVEISGGKSEMVKFNAEMKIDEFGEFDQMYTECWRTLKNYFYDEEMHGVDWQSVYDKYYPQLQGIRTKGELFSIIREMYGELNASHLGIWGYGSNSRNLGYLGINIEPADNGYYRITEVLPDGPADTDDANQLNVGEYIISVDRDEITTDDNFYKYFLGTIGKRLRIEVSEDPNSGENRVVWITPCGNWEFQTKHYERWVTERKEIVTEKSGEKIGYIHIRSMNGSSFEQFKKELFYEVDSKDALILDVRFNGGGYTHDMIMDILEREPMMYRKTRLRHKKRIQPDKMWGDKPLILLINEHSFSDAEIFPHIFRVRELGTIVGVPTAGGVIGTGGIKLIDGSHFRVPRTGWYSLDGKNLENWGIEPDIYIENHPNELEKGIDSQLLKAIEIAKEKIE